MVVGVVLLCELFGLRYIANNRVGIVEKLWSVKGSVPEGGIIALNGEAGFQAEVLRGGLHFGMWRWEEPPPQGAPGAVPPGEIGFVYPRGGGAPAPRPTPGLGGSRQQLPGWRRFLL